MLDHGVSSSPVVQILFGTDRGAAPRNSAAVNFFFSMKRCYSLKRNKEFRRVYNKGRSFVSHTIRMVYLPSGNDEIKIGFAVGKKIGNAVTRNRCKRRLREAITPLLPEIAPGCRLVFIARSAITEASFSEIESTVRRLVQKAGLLG